MPENDSERIDTRPYGRRRYRQQRARWMNDPEFRAVYAEEAAKKELRPQLIEARQDAGLTQSEVAERLS